MQKGKKGMKDLFSVNLPKNTPKDQAKLIQKTLKEIQGVKDAGSDDARGIDPARVMLWVQTSSGLLGAAGTGASIVKKVAETIRGKGISGASIELPGGVKISVDNASASDIERIISAAMKK